MRSASQASSITADLLHDYEEMIEDTKSDLNVQLELINEKLKEIVARDTESLSFDPEELQLVKEEQFSSKKCLEIITRLSWQVEKSQQIPRHHDGSLESTASTAGIIITDDALQECKRSLAETSAKFEKHQEVLMNQLLVLSKIQDPSVEEAAQFAKLQEEWGNIRQCLAISSKAIQLSGQGQLRETEDLSQELQLEPLANNDRISSSSLSVEESKPDNKPSTERITDSGNTPKHFHHPIPGAGDNQIDISNPPSVFSLATMPSTTLTTDTRLTADEMLTAIDELVGIFLEDAEMIYLFREAISKRHMASDRLERNFRRLMKRFATNLKDEAQEAIDLDLANLILSRASLLAEKIGSRFREESSRLDTFTRGSPPMGTSVEVAFRLAEDICDVSSDEEDDGVEPGLDDRFSALVSHGRSFIEESAAFQKLREEFKNFLMPTVKPIVLDFSFNSKQWMIRYFWSLESLLASIGPRDKSDSPCLVSSRPPAVSPPREIMLFSEPLTLNADINSTELPISWHISRSIGFLGLSFKLNLLLWAIRVSWKPQKFFSSFGLRDSHPSTQYQFVLLCQPCHQGEPQFEGSTRFAWECVGVESKVDEKNGRGRISWDPAEILRCLCLREKKIPKHHKRFRWINVSLNYLASSTMANGP